MIPEREEIRLAAGQCRQKYRCFVGVGVRVVAERALAYLKSPLKRYQQQSQYHQALDYQVLDVTKDELGLESNRKYFILIKLDSKRIA